MSTNRTYRALVYTDYGEAPRVLRLELKEEAAGPPGPGRARVRMSYSPVNPSDLYNTIGGQYREALNRVIWNQGQSPLTLDPARTRPLPAPPAIPGFEGSGVVDAVGEGVDSALVGRRVAVLAAGPGNWREFVDVPTANIFVLPDSISLEQGAMAIINPVTAVAMLRHELRVPGGEWLLQSAAASALGRMVIRLARRDGIKTLNVVRRPEHVEVLRGLGADEVLVVEGDPSELPGQVAALTGNQGVGYALDPVAGAMGSALIRCLSMGGRLLVYGTLSKEPLQFSSRDLMTPVASVRGFLITNWLAVAPGGVTLRLLMDEALGLIAEGVLDSTVDEIFPLEAYEAAMIKAAGGASGGRKILLKLDAD